MALTIYEVVSGGTKKHHPPGGEDWSVLVAAHNPAEARDIACHETEIARPWVIYEWGTDGRETAKPGVLRGPFENCPAVGRGWKMYQEDWKDKSVSPWIIESPKPPPVDGNVTTQSSQFTCCSCGKVASGDSYFTITAAGYVDNGKSGSGRHYTGADMVNLSLWYVADYETKRMHEMRLDEGKSGVANLSCCSAECLKNFLCASIDKLARRTTHL